MAPRLLPSLLLLLLLLLLGQPVRAQAVLSCAGAATCAPGEFVVQPCVEAVLPLLRDSEQPGDVAVSGEWTAQVRKEATNKLII